MKDLTLREYLAALAMQGLCPSMPAERAAQEAVKCADALIKELDKKNEKDKD